MRQAGRYLPEYREVRAKAGSFLDLCYNPKLAAEVTLQPLKRFDLDAAILFADILVVPHAMGLGLRFAEGEGPVLETVRDRAAVQRLKSVAGSAEISAVCETVGKVRKGLSREIGLIGFCGGPWTVASYMVEGGSSDRNRARLAAYNAEGWFTDLIDRLVVESTTYLCQQIEAGAQAVQIFNSWAGELAGVARTKFVIEPLSRLVKQVRHLHPSVPVIVFARGIGSDHQVIADVTGANAVGVETESSMSAVVKGLRDGVAVQGNLDPVALLADDAALEREVDAVASAVAMQRHIFNLGHGIRQETDLNKLTVVVDRIRAFDRAASNG